MLRIRLLTVIPATSLILAACTDYSAFSTGRVVFIPIDAAIWTADLPTASTAFDISISGIQNDQWASLHFTKYGSLETRFYPSPLQILEPVLEAYGANQIDAFDADSPAVSMSISGFKVLLNADYDSGELAATLQFQFSVTREARTITAIGSSPFEEQPNAIVIQQAMHDALASAIEQSRLLIHSVLNRPT